MDKAEWLAEIKKMRGIDIYFVIGKFDDDPAASLLAKHFGPETPTPAFKPAGPATGESALASDLGKICLIIKKSRVRNYFGAIL